MGKISETIVEEREEMMISPNGDSNPTLRTAHFIKPTIVVAVTDRQSVSLTLNVAPFLLSSKPNTYNMPNLRKKVNFSPSRYYDNPWKSWVDRLRSKHESTWKKAGVFEAISSSSSTYKQPPRLNEVIFGVAEKWCPETNTFVFPWGEATISLEDMIVLGGFSVLGDSVSLIKDDDDMKETENCLLKAVRDIKRLTGQYPRVKTWMDYIDDDKQIECEIEHEAFLYCWLSRYVFTLKADAFGKHLFPLAICLARGTRMALAPAVLACLYKNLSALKSRMMIRADEDDETVLTLSAPFHLVHLWIWKRFPTFRQTPNLIQCDHEPGLVRWNYDKVRQVEDVRLELDSAGENFQWRPYAPSNVYTDRERLVLVDSCLAEEIQSFVRCIRVSELVGLDGVIEQYLPHRIAMQFGFDQDLPGHVARLNESVEEAWANYIRPIDDVQQLYIPAQFFEADVTTRYLEWWKHLSIDRQDSIIKGVVRKRRSPRRHTRSLKRILINMSSERMKDNTMPPYVVPGQDIPPPPPPLDTSNLVVPGFRLHHKTDRVHFKDFPPPPPPPGITNLVVPGNQKTDPSARYKDIPPLPGFAPKFKRVKLIAKNSTCHKNEKCFSPTISRNADQRLKISTHQQLLPSLSSRAFIGTEHKHENVEDMSIGSTDVGVTNDEVLVARGLEGGEVDNGRASGEGILTSNHSAAAVAAALCCVHEVKVLELESRLSKLEQELADTLKSVKT